MSLTPAEIELVKIVVAYALQQAPGLILLMNENANIPISELWPTPTAVQEANIRVREGKQEPPFK